MQNSKPLNNIKRFITDSKTIAKTIGCKHRKVIKAIDSVLDDYKHLKSGSTPPKVGITPVFIPKERTYKNKAITVFILNESAFNLILPRLKTRKALDAHLHLVTVFQTMNTAMFQVESSKSGGMFETLRLKPKKPVYSLIYAIESLIEYSMVQEHINPAENTNLYMDITQAIYKYVGVNIEDGLGVLDSLPFEILRFLERVEEASSSIIMDGIENKASLQAIKSKLNALVSHNGGEVCAS